MVLQQQATRGRIPLPALAGLAQVFALLLLAINYFLVRTSSILNLRELRYDLVGDNPDGPGGWTSDWLWDQAVPFKYRLLGKLPVWAATEGLQRLGVERDRAFYGAYVAVLLVFLFLALLAVGAFTRALAEEAFGPQSRREQFGVAACAMLLFALSPPVLFFCKYPVHGTPNDLLGYALMAAGLHLALRGRLAAVSALAALAVFCRETTLLVPFALLFFRHLPWRRRLPAALLPVAVLAAYRLLWPGSYDPVDAWSMNAARPLETLSFALLVFGPLWILGPLGYRDLAARGAQLPPPLRGLLRSFPWALALALCITLLFGRLREIRIPYMLCIYFVPLSAIWLQRCGGRLAALARSRGALLWALAVLILVFRLRVSLLPVDAAQQYWLASRLGVMFFGYTNQPQHNWVMITMVYLALFLLALPLLALRWTGGGAARSA